MTQELEFHISVTPVRGNEYFVRTEDVAHGVPLAEEIVEWPVSDWLACASQLMDDPLLGLLEESDIALPSQTVYGGMGVRGVGSSGETGVGSLLGLGRQLHQHLFQGRLRDSWISAQSIAHNRGARLRLRLGLKGAVLPRLPWEVLHDGNRPIATGEDVLFSRYQPLTTGITQALANGQCESQTPTRLKILMVLAGPTDQDRLQLKQEAEHLQRELLSGSSVDSPRSLTILEQPDRAALTQALEHNQYQVFHYAGHSNLGSKGGELYLVNRKTGLTETLNGYDLAGLLANNGVQLAVFNSCRGAGMYLVGSSNDTGERNLAEALVNRGIPAVLAMAERIPDDVALTLAQLFYRNLNLGKSVDLSLSRARQALLSAYGSKQLYWALPILYLHPKFDGCLRSSFNSINSILSTQSEVVLPALSPNRSVQQPKPDDGENLDDGELDWIVDEMNYGDFREDLEEFKDDELMDLEEVNEVESENFNDQQLDDGAEAMVASLLRQLSSSDVLPATGNPPASPDLIFSDEELEQYDLEKYQQLSDVSNSNLQEQHPKESEPIQQIPPARLTASTSETLNNNVGRRSVERSGWIAKAVASVVAVGVLTVVGFWFLRSRVEEKNVAIPVEKSVPAQSLNTIDLEKTPTSQVVAIAIDRFSQENLKDGLPAVEALLNRSALPQAQAALAAVSKKQENQPEVNFLKGRLVWQFAAAGNQLYSQSDARRFWDVAVKDNGKFPEYFNALGFAYYAEGNLDRAAQMWGQAVATMPKNTIQKGAIRPDLTAYAGSALVFYKQAKSMAGEPKEVRLSKAIKFRNYILSEDAISFQPDALSKNWMWSDEAIKDWQEVLELK